MLDIRTTEGTKIDEPRAEADIYRRIVGKLLWLTRQTSPDIVSRSIKTSSPYVTTSHLPYDRRFPPTALCMYNQASRNHTRPIADKHLLGYSDANFAPAEEDRYNTSGYIYMIHGAPISWKSALLRNVTISTYEAEFCEISEAARAGIPLNRLLLELGCFELQGGVQTVRSKSKIVQLYLLRNHEAAIPITKGKCGLGRVKHVDNHYRFALQRYQRGNLSIDYVATTKMAADGLMKLLASLQFANFFRQLGLSHC